MFGKTANAIKKRVQYICKRAGLRGSKLGAHTFRHSSASLVAEETQSVLAVKALLQHDEQATSMVYIHDVEDKIVDTISPLKLVAERYAKQENGGNGAGQVGFKMLSDGSGIEVEQEEVSTELVLSQEEASDLEEFWANSLPDVPEGANVRPLLKTMDLHLIKKVFAFYLARSYNVQDRGECQRLMARMLRKVK